MNTTAVCIKCNLDLPIEEFRWVDIKKGIRSQKCKLCKYTRNNPHRKEMQKLYSERSAAKIQSANPIDYLLRGAKNRAARNGIEFNITAEDLGYPTHCPVLGIELKYHTIGNKHENKDASASIDRIDNTKGYVKGNVVLVSFKVNRSKLRLTLAEIQAFAKFYSKF